MSPQGKASIIRAIQDVNKDFHVFMCGDGGNDVGALKQVISISIHIIYYICDISISINMIYTYDIYICDCYLLLFI